MFMGQPGSLSRSQDDKINHRLNKLQIPTAHLTGLFLIRIAHSTNPTAHFVLENALFLGPDYMSNKTANINVKNNSLSHEL